MSSPDRRVRLTVSRPCPAPADRVWDTLVDWRLHKQWMVLTRAHGGSGVGARVEAFTGVGPLAFRDPMEITGWQPATPTTAGYCETRHLGKVVRGWGRFDVEPAPGGMSTVTWTEWVDLPLGRLGRAGWPIVQPLLANMFDRSLRALGRLAARTRR
ncbi:SRPBCC family protein [Salinactinospora qingdaonensis]|uniref:SRPBCC family protein n=1 Tax=Salinactinospora qingdaonensis TaxID=702744 RepID=A0ABP7FJC0_9ACTN